MVPDEIEFTGLTEAHLDGALALSREAGWPHRREDWAMALSLGQGIAALRDGAVVGTAMATPLGDGATVSLVIVSAALRGRQIGRRLMDAAVEACGAREARLIATEDGLPLYRKLGFAETHEIRQHQGLVVAVPAEAPPAGTSLHWAGAEELPAIGAMDQAALGLDRAALLALLMREGRVAVLRDGGQAVGFGALRRFGRGEVAGPVVARGEPEARAILDVLIAARTEPFLRVDTPAFATLGPWLAARGLAPAGGGIAMRRLASGQAPGSDLGPDPAFQTFALASQALG